jgi:8-amino-7-oxononanoate synthase
MNSGSDDPLAWLDEKLDVLAKRGLRRQRRPRTSPCGPRIVVEGRELVNFGSNDYLNLAGDPRLASAASAAIDESGWGAGASPLITGYTVWHERLERRLAEFLQTDAALVFSSGYAANVGTITALTGPDDAVFSDEKNHASIIDGCRLSRAAVHVYRHCDCDHLQSLLTSTIVSGRRLIITDTVFSMDGDTAPLTDIAELARRHGAMLMIDEAHATGVFGPHGRGLAEELGVQPHIDIHVGTLSKALGSSGGFVAGSRRLIEWLLNRARSYVFSTAPPAANCAAAIAALDIVRDDPQRRRKLLDLAERLRTGLRAQNWDTGSSSSQIVPIIVGESDKAMQLAAGLREQGFFVPGIRPPTVPMGQSLLRISLTSAHSNDIADAVVAALQTARKTP